MRDPSATEASENPRLPGADAGIYLDFSALAKIYVPEAGSEKLDSFLRGKRDLVISELAITVVLSAVARRKREGVLNVDQASEIRNAVLEDAESGSFDRLELNPRLYRCR
jgi:predicted nucleic acid-binding protein